MLKVAGRHGSRSMMQSARFAVVKEHRHRAGCCPVVFRWLMLTCNVVTFLVLVPYNGPRGPTYVTTANHSHHPINASESCMSANTTCCGLPLCDTYPCALTPKWQALKAAVGSYGEHASRPCFGWQFIYLTFIGGCTQTAYFAFACVQQVIERNSFPGDKNAHNLRKHRDRFFGLAFSIGTMIGIIFWTILYPFGPKTPMETFYAFLEHGCTTIFIWVELFMFPHEYGSFKIDLLIAGVYGFLYLGWNEVCHSINGFWTYPFQRLIEVWYMQIVGYAGITLLILGIYAFGRYLNNRVWHAHFIMQAMMRSDSFSELSKDLAPGEDSWLERLSSASTSTSTSASTPSTVTGEVL